jgi:hypothetical protein
MTEAINRDLIFQFVFNGNWKQIGRKKLRKLERNWKIIGGSWLTVKKHGNGKYTFVNGAVYEGEWKDCKRHGNGKLTLADGSVCHDGEWKV